MHAVLHDFAELFEGKRAARFFVHFVEHLGALLLSDVCVAEGAQCSLELAGADAAIVICVEQCEGFLEFLHVVFVDEGAVFVCDLADLVDVLLTHAGLR